MTTFGFRWSSKVVRLGSLPQCPQRTMPANRVRSLLRSHPLPTFSELGLHILLPDTKWPLRLRLGESGGWLPLISSRSGRRQRRFDVSAILAGSY